MNLCKQTQKNTSMRATKNIIYLLLLQYLNWPQIATNFAICKEKNQKNLFLENDLV